jgi:hypothetical protein
MSLPLKDLSEYYYLLSAAAVSERAEQIFQLAVQGDTHFSLHLEKLENIAELTLSIMHAQYPQSKIPLHSRWRHFEIDNCDYAKFLQQLPILSRVKAQIDLAFISVLLDAGAGPAWAYCDSTGRIRTRSEGLALASLEMFKNGLFSVHRDDPWRVDAEALQNLSLEKLRAGLQVRENNFLLGLEGRLQLLQRLGDVLTEESEIFPGARIGDLYDFISAQFGQAMTATDLVNVLLLRLNAIWPQRSVDHYPLGDTWEYLPIGWVPFHKLTLWLTLSLIEPLQNAGMQINGLEELPGLAEYRNGGLFLDGGVLQVKAPELLTIIHEPSANIIIEWRALTIALLNKLAPIIRKKLHVDAKTLPLVNILQGGTWQAGRQLALQRSPAAEPPLRYQSTGTVF